MRKTLELRVVRIGIGCFVALVAACATIFALNLLAAPRPLAELLPTRTATRRPAPSITPVAYPPTPQLVSRDDFSSQENFPHATGVKLGYDYQDGAYLLTPPLDPGIVRVLDQNFTNPDYRNLTLHAVAAPAENSKSIAYGLLFWHGEDDRGRERFIAFVITPASQVRLLTFEPDPTANNDTNQYKLTDIIPAQKSDAVLGGGRPNDLRVDVHPRRLLAYVNDQLVADTDDKIINDWRLRLDWDGRVGLVALYGSEPGESARFTRFDIYADVKQP